MRVQPVSSPHMIQPTGAQSSGAQDARAKAISILTAQPAQQPVQNQNAISPEEMAVVMPKQLPKTEPIGQTDQLEATEVPASPPPAEDPALSRQFAQLARQEKAMRLKVQQQDQAIKAREAALAAREAEINAKDASYKSDYVAKSQLKQNTLQLLAEQGISYEELTQQILNQQPTDPRMEATINKLQAKIEQLEQDGQQAKKAQADQQTAAYQAAVKQIEQDARKLVYTDPSFETVKATNSVKDVVELITRTYDRDGVLLSVEEAAEQVENYLMDEAMKITKIEKIQKKLGLNAQSSKAPTQIQAASQQTQSQKTMKTLTNSNTSSRQLSAKERAILAFKGELK